METKNPISEAKTTILAITGPSGSGKSTLQQYLVENFGFRHPYNFTTRPPRTNAELDDYVFITKPQFYKKLENGDFADFTIYHGNYYGMSKCFKPLEKTAIVVTPHGREIFREFCAKRGIEFKEVFLTVDEKTMDYRLGIKRRESYQSIEFRKNDLKWMKPTNESLVLDGREDTAILADKIADWLDDNVTE